MSRRVGEQLGREFGMSAEASVNHMLPRAAKRRDGNADPVGGRGDGSSSDYRGRRSKRNSSHSSISRGRIVWSE